MDNFKDFSLKHSDKQGKGSNDPIKMVNKYGILDDDMETT